jgi:hypothetical protein
VNNDFAIKNTTSSSLDNFARLEHNNLSCNIKTEIPSLNDPPSDGKFPQIGDEDIIGPMVQAEAQL